MSVSNNDVQQNTVKLHRNSVLGFDYGYAFMGFYFDISHPFGPFSSWFLCLICHVLIGLLSYLVLTSVFSLVRVRLVLLVIGCLCYMFPHVHVNSV